VRQKFPALIHTRNNYSGIDGSSCKGDGDAGGAPFPRYRTSSECVNIFMKLVNFEKVNVQKTGGFSVRANFEIQSFF
jgi:hypothetical protein